MFNQQGVTDFYRTHRKTFELMVKLEREINQRLFAMEPAVECMMIATLTGEAMVMIGPPGTAKSRLIRVFCNLLGLLDDEALSGANNAKDNSILSSNKRYFEYLLTQFTEPSELFGFYDLGQFQRGGDLVRMTNGMMQEAEVVFLDEIFNANSAILNSLLTFLNERMFHDRGQVVRSPLKVLFSATNHTPQEPGLQAVFDRFLFRVRLESIDADRALVSQMLSRGWSETQAPKALTGSGRLFDGLLDGVNLVRADLRERSKARALVIDDYHPLMAHLTDLIRGVRDRELSAMSNRRVVKLASAVFYMRMLRAARSGADDAVIVADDLDVVVDYGLDREDASVKSQLRENWQDRA
jgi:MoxR-like ATPase